MSKVCLNMIVKNESKIITRLLESVLSLIDSYCICDTGSTDNTVDVIKTFFEEKQIPGKVVIEPFKDFGYNRTFALQQCEDMDNADYILLLDADMILKFGNNFTPSDFKEFIKNYDVLYMYQGSDQFFYKNVRVVKNRKNISYWGVTHEYVKVFDGAKYGTFDRNIMFINDIGDGGSKSDKFERDVALLTRALEETPNNDRYTFYLANSLRDSGQTDKAIETYKKRIELKGWFEEVWFSYYSIGRCYQSKGDMANALFYWMEAYNYFPKRLENIYEIINYYRNNGKNELAYSFYHIADEKKKTIEKLDYLFLHKDVYDYKLDYELTIVGYYCNHYSYDLLHYCMRVLCSNCPDENILKNVLSNYKFYTPSLKDLSVPTNSALKLNVEEDKYDYDEFVSSTPSITMHNDELTVNVRFVNYKIDDKGGYVNKEHIETRNVITTFNINGNTWIKTNEVELKHDKSVDNLYIGLEDVRIFSHKGKLLYNANRGLGWHDIQVEHGSIDLENGNISGSSLLVRDGQQTIEKNWILFEDSNENLKCIYGWYPLTIGDIDNSRDKSVPDNLLFKPTTPNYNITHRLDTPVFFKYIRGSTNGVLVGNEIWFICHVVSYEDRRYYYHVLVALDKDTLNVSRFSKMFTFEKNKVEYTLGFVYNQEKEELIIGYSLMDRETHYMTVPKQSMEELFFNPKLISAYTKK